MFGQNFFIYSTSWVVSRLWKKLIYVRRHLTKMLMLFKVWKWSSIKNTLFLTINSSFIRTCKQVFYMIYFYFLYWWFLCLVASGVGRAVGGGGPPHQPVPGRHQHADTSSRVDGRGTNILRPCFWVHLVMKDMQTILT